ncbi:unnamed protein product [marine sediment metagenome]|uniref:Acyl-CoA dehydrogenase/oxidase N-terminal domain-containing protein n=1 Tax=marine sediment metagenome TaxID=412755 RepID=X1MRX7_9ZZZZ
MILHEKHKKFRQKVKDFADNEVAPRAKELDIKHEFPWDLVKRMAELELLALYVPKEYGGAGFDVLSYAIAVEEIGRVCGSTGIFLAAHSSLGVYPIFVAGTEEQKQKYLIPLARGEKIGSFGLTEPNAGSDAAGTQTTAKLVGDEYVVNGTKRFITSGSVADIIIFTATITPVDAQTREISSIAIANETKSKPEPPYSSGTTTPKRPNSAIFFMLFQGKSPDLSISGATGANSASTNFLTWSCNIF